MWRDIVKRSVDDKLAKSLNLKKAIIDSENNYAKIVFISDCLFSVKNISALKKAFEKSLGENTHADIFIEYRGMEDYLKDQQALCEYLKEYLLYKKRALAPFLSYMEMEYLEGFLNVSMPNQISFDIWHRANCTEFITEFMQESFNLRVLIKCRIRSDEVVLKVIEPEYKYEAPIIEQKAPDEKKKAREAGFYKKAAPVAPSVADNDILYGDPFKRVDILKIDSLYEDSGKLAVEGELFKLEDKDTFKGDRTIFSFNLYDNTGSISCRLMVDKEISRDIKDKLKGAKWVRAFGSTRSDKFTGFETLIDVKSIVKIKEPEGLKRVDDAPIKRVELHLHTHMSSLDSMLGISDAVKAAKAFGHSALAVTDHGVVQAYPEFYDEAKRAEIKAIYGMEGYLVDDSYPISIDNSFVVVNLETTGLKASLDYIIQISALKIERGKITDKFFSYVASPVKISEKITSLIGITDETLIGAPNCESALKNFREFCGSGFYFVTHNAAVDIKFLFEHGQRYGLDFSEDYVDTLTLSRIFFNQELEEFKLNIICKHLKISIEQHHNADYDTAACAEIFLHICDLAKQKEVFELPSVNMAQRDSSALKKARTKHILFLVRDSVGLENMYRLVTRSHLDHFQRRPRIPRSLLMYFKKGLILGSACEAGELFQAILNQKSMEEIEKIASFYDFLEIQPICNNEFLLRNGTVENREMLKDFNRLICDIANKQGKLCAATCDVHFKNPKDEHYRRIIQGARGYDDADNQAMLYFRTTTEMLDEFSYLGSEKAYEVVVTNTNMIAEKCDMMRAFPKETCAPIIDGAEDELVDSSYELAHSIYGNPLPPVVFERLERELSAITKYGFAVLYVIARKLVLKSNADGYLVGSRGSVGSSFVAFTSGITEVNALQPHYVCPNCKDSDFDIDLKKYSCGCDMEDKLCPKCGTLYKKDGYHIPFETFLGFEGDKVPDIDLNFSGEYQPHAHAYTVELFGKDHVFRAGTISGIQDKTAYGYVAKYNEQRNINATRAEMERLAIGCCGVKRTTGQHPGGLVVVPKNRSVFEFTPLQRPADDVKSTTITTHFDFASMHDTLVKLDILGHDDPTVIRMLQDLIGIDPKTIPLDDKATMSLFSSTDALGINADDLMSPVATYGVPEFGTFFVRQMLCQTRPTTMEELVRISGLSHGTDVWTNNAENLVKEGIATLSEAICTRDDIMNFLILCGVPKKMSFTIMESVRKGKGLKPEMEEAMKEANVPAWYIDSCKKIKYMFPRAHAAAYVMMAFRIAYCKVHHPAEYYAAYFTVRADCFDIAQAIGGVAEVKKRIRDIDNRGKEATDKDKNQKIVLEIVLEMNLRGIVMENVNLMQSDAGKFAVLDKNRLLAPFNSIDKLGPIAAQGIADARKIDGEMVEFLSKEDLRIRAKIGKGAIEILDANGCTAHLPDTNQTTLF